MKTRLLVACTPGLLAFFAFSCSSPDFCVGAECGGDAGGKDGATDATVHDDGASDGGSDADSTVIPPGCDPTGDLAMQAACVTETDGFFVDSTAAVSSAKGTRAAPFATIQAAVNATSGAKPNVFVCAGNYPEQVQMSKSANLYGGFDCGTWVDSKLGVTVKPSGAGYALQMTGVSAAIVEDVELDSQDGANPGDSSVAVFASGSTATFRRVKIVAGNAGSTPDAGSPAQNYSVSSAAQGWAGDGGAGVAAQPCLKCLNGEQSTGGASGTATPTGGSAGLQGLPTIPGGNNDGLGGTYNSSKGQCEPGDNGSNSLLGGGGAGAVSNGVLTATDWLATGGTVGSPAHVAQGGGGGSGGTGTATGAGGGGGCGGCGGGGGAGGGAGGSSFAVLSFQSTLTFDSCTLSASAPANGGPGGDGQSGQSGGNGGVESSPGCPGGGGGAGGGGGGGGGGAAGLSVDVGFVGPMPNILLSTTPSFSTVVAAGGPSGAHGLADGGEGKTGANQTMLELPTQ